MSSPNEMHERDEQCDVDPADDTCRVCGVLHGDPCPTCGGRGFHRAQCPESDEGGLGYIERSRKPTTPKRRTLASARAELRAARMTLTKRDGEYRVNFTNGDEATAYYTSDIDDAVETGFQMNARGGSR